MLDWLRSIGEREVTFRVTGGVHTGASALLDRQVLTIGSSTEADIVLHDAGIAAVHARLRFKGSHVEVEAVGGDIVLADGRVVPEGNGRRCGMPFDAAIGGAQVLLANPAVAPRRAGGMARLLPAAMLLMAAFAVFVAANGLSLAETGGKDGIGENAMIATASVEGDSRETAAQGSAGDAAERLRVRLAELGLETLNVAETGGRLIVAGTVPAAQSALWSNAQAWFDQTFGADVVLVSNAVVGSGAQGEPRLTLQAIWHGERPYIIAGDGARYHEGAFTNDGWLIKRIGDRELVLEKGGAGFALKYP
nr:EscD/YscD/HrpQ family type III secretion system periplasmic domain-containing protein [Nitratireductor pacificus]